MFLLLSVYIPAIYCPNSIAYSENQLSIPQINGIIIYRSKRDLFSNLFILKLFIYIIIRFIIIYFSISLFYLTHLSLNHSICENNPNQGLERFGIVFLYQAFQALSTITTIITTLQRRIGRSILSGSSY